MKKKQTLPLFVCFILFCIPSSGQQNVMWAEHIGGLSYIIGQSIAVDDQGFVYSTGSFEDTINFPATNPIFTLVALGPHDLYVAKQDPNGNFLNVVSIGDTEVDEGRGITVSPSGNVYVTGVYTDGTTNQRGAIVVKFDNNLNEIWRNVFYSSPNAVTPQGNYAAGNSIVVDDDENVFVVGDFAGHVDFPPGFSYDAWGLGSVFIARLTPDSGEVVWVRNIGGDWSDQGTGIAMGDPAWDDCIYVTGNFKFDLYVPYLPNLQLPSAHDFYDIFIARIDKNGDFYWVERFGGENHERAMDIVVDQYIYITGSLVDSPGISNPGTSGFDFITYAPGGYYDPFISKHDVGDGHCIWAAQIRGLSSPGSGGTGFSIDLDPTGNKIYASGSFWGEMDFDPGAGNYSLDASSPWPWSETDLFISVLSAYNGDFLDAFHMGGVDPGGHYFSGEQPHGIAVDEDDCIHITGNFFGSVDVDPGTSSIIFDATHYDAFTQKLCHQPVVDCCEDYQNFLHEINLMQQQWEQVSVDSLDCSYTVSITLPNDCYKLLTATPDWGDGTIPTGGITTGTNFSWTHPYTQPGSYQICIEVAEFDNNQICQNHQAMICVDVMIDDLTSDSFYIEDDILCNTPEPFYIPIVANSACIPTQIQYFARECGTTGPFQNYYTGTGTNPSILYPSNFGNECVEIYARVSFDGGPSCCGITSFDTDTVQISLCSPLNVRFWTFNYAFCETAPPQNLLYFFTNYQPPGYCLDNVQWSYQHVPFTHNDSTFTTPQHDFLGAPEDCFYDHIYTVQATNICGVSTTQATIRVFNPDIPTGSLSIDPLKDPPLCYGDDATVVFTPHNCVNLWQWHTNNVPNPVDPSDYVPMLGFGSNTPLLNTNILNETTWFMVTSNNGECPTVPVHIEIPVKSEISIHDFSITHDACLEELDFLLEFSPASHPGPPSCNYEVELFFNGVLFYSNTYTSSPAAISLSANSNELAGNYQAIIKDSCCTTEFETDIITVEPVCEPVLSGPCYKCYEDATPITLEASMLLPTGQPCSTTCTFQWLDANQNPIPGANSLIYQTNTGGLFYFQSECNGCIKTTSIYVADCAPCTTKDNRPDQCPEISVYPNPGKGNITIQVDPEPLTEASVVVLDQSRTAVYSRQLEEGIVSHNVMLDFLPAGFYQIQVTAKDLPPFSRKILIVE